METPQSETKPNPMKSEHLTEGVPAIMACVGTDDQYGSEIEIMEKIGENIDYFNNTANKNSNYSSSKHRAYVISDIDTGIKFTKKMFMCTSIIAVGVDKETGENISFLTHQDYPSVLGSISFENYLKERIKELMDKSVEGTVDIVISGGMLSDDFDYSQKIRKLDSIISETVGYSPVVICGPKEDGYVNDDIYFDTRNRRLYVIRPKDHVVHNDPFVASDVEEVKNKDWKGADNSK